MQLKALGFIVLFFAVIASIAQLGLTFTLWILAAVAGSIIAVFVIWQGWIIQMALNAAEINIGKYHREWLGGSVSRPKKRNERREDLNWIADSTVATTLAPGSRYRLGQHSDVRILAVREAENNVSYETPGMWLAETNEADRKKSSRRKQTVRNQAVLYLVLYHAGPQCVLEEIDEQRLEARRQNTTPPSFDPHLTRLAKTNPIILWLVTRILRHPGKRLWIKVDGKRLTRWDALNFLEDF